MSTAQELEAQLNSAKEAIGRLQSLDAPRQLLAEVNALLQQAGTGQYNDEIGLGENALNDFAGAMQQLSSKVDEHLAQLRSLMGG